MTELEDPREQLRAIRSLMERATIYRALSAPTALVGGLLSLGAFGVARMAAQSDAAGLSRGFFVLLWLGVLTLTGLFNTVFLWRAALRRGDIFFSPGMRTALISLAPAFVVAGIFTIVVLHPLDLCILWILLYGLGLLATQHFAPRSLVMLGAAFFVIGCSLAICWRAILFTGAEGPSTAAVSAIMAAVFGGVHLIYAVAVWTLGEERRANEA